MTVIVSCAQCGKSVDTRFTENVACDDYPPEDPNFKNSRQVRVCSPCLVECGDEFIRDLVVGTTNITCEGCGNMVNYRFARTTADGVIVCNICLDGLV